MNDRKLGSRRERRSHEDSDDLGPGRIAPSARLRTPSEPETSSLVQRSLDVVQLRAVDAEVDPDHVRAHAARGLAGPAGSLPHLDTIQAAFGRHDVGSIDAHVGGAAAEASAAMGARAYAADGSIAFAQTPDLHTAAHEAAHVVQQRADLSPSGGIGRVGDDLERHADIVADAVVAGKSAEAELDHVVGGERGTPARAVQRRAVAGGHVVPDDMAVTWNGDRFAVSFDVDKTGTMLVRLRYVGPNPVLGGISWDVATKSTTLRVPLGGKVIKAPVATPADDGLSFALGSTPPATFQLKHTGSIESAPQPHRQHFVVASVDDAMADQAIARIADPSAVSALSDDPLAANTDPIVTRPQAGRVSLAESLGRDLFAQVRAGQWDRVNAALQDWPMASMLDVLQVARKDGLLDALAARVAFGRAELAVLTVGMHFGFRWKALLDTAKADDKDAVTAHSQARMLAGDTGARKPLFANKKQALFVSSAPDAATWLDEFLTYFDLAFSPHDGKTVFNGDHMTVLQIVDVAVEQAAMAGQIVDANACVATIEKKLGSVAKPTVEAIRKYDDSSQLVVQYGVAYMRHVPLDGGPSSTDNPNHQFQLVYTVQMHKDGTPGLELSFVAQVAAFADASGHVKVTKDVEVQQTAGGLQAAYVAPFIGTFSTIQAVAQVLDGVAFDKQKRDGTVFATPHRTDQVAVQAQAVFDIVGNDKLKLQLVAMGQLSATNTGGNATIDYGAGCGVQLTVGL
jgi:hypothetical protein